MEIMTILILKWWCRNWFRSNFLLCHVCFWFMERQKLLLRWSVNEKISTYFTVYMYMIVKVIFKDHKVSHVRTFDWLSCHNLGLTFLHITISGLKVLTSFVQKDPYTRYFWLWPLARLGSEWWVVAQVSNWYRGEWGQGMILHNIKFQCTQRKIGKVYTLNWEQYFREGKMPRTLKLFQFGSWWWFANIHGGVTWGGLMGQTIITIHWQRTLTSCKTSFKTKRNKNKTKRNL